MCELNTRILRGGTLGAAGWTGEVGARPVIGAVVGGCGLLMIRRRKRGEIGVRDGGAERSGKTDACVIGFVFGVWKGQR